MKKTYIIILVIIILSLIGGFVYLNKDKLFNKKVPVDPATIEQTSKEEKKDNKTAELPRGIESITQEVHQNSLSDISKTVKENNEKKLAEENAKIDEFSGIINDYIQKINKDEDITNFISQESLKKIKEMTIKRYNGFSENDKVAFIKDLNEIGYNIKEFNPTNEKEMNGYINFIIKGGLKTNGKIEEITDVSGKYDEKNGNFCGKFTIKYEGNKSKTVESLCINSDKKLLIHSL